MAYFKSVCTRHFTGASFDIVYTFFNRLTFKAKHREYHKSTNFIAISGFWIRGELYLVGVRTFNSALYPTRIHITSSVIWKWFRSTWLAQHSRGLYTIIIRAIFYTAEIMFHPISHPILHANLSFVSLHLWVTKEETWYQKNLQSFAAINRWQCCSAISIKSSISKSTLRLMKENASFSLDR